MGWFKHDEAPFLSRLVSVSVRDPDDARRRRLLNILLLCLVLFVTFTFFAALILRITTPFPMLTGDLPYLRPSIALVGALVIYLVNRYWSGEVAATLFLLAITASAFLLGVEPAVYGKGLLILAIPIVVGSFLLRAYAGFIFALLNSTLLIFVQANMSQRAADATVVPFFFLLALVSWISAQVLEDALIKAREVNRELDRRVAERTADLERRTIQLKTAAAVARDATAIIDVDHLLRETVEFISERFGFYHAGVFLLDEKKEYAVLRAASSEGGHRMLERGHQLPVGRVGIVGYVAGSGKSRIALDVGKDSVHFVNPDLPETRSEMALPLISRGEIIGVLDVQSVREAVFTEEDLAALQTMADQLANAIENARLYEEANRHVEELTALHNIDIAMISTLDMGDVLRVIYEQVCAVMEVDTFYIALRRNGDESLDFPIIVDRGEHQDPDVLGEEVRQGFAQWVVRTRQPLWIGNMDHTTVPVEGINLGLRTRSLLVSPLIVHDKVAGVISVQSYRPYAFDESHRRLFSSIAGQVAVAVENARLYQQLEDRTRELSRAYDRLKEVDRLRTQLVQNVSHELRTPLSLVKGYVELLADGDLGPLREGQKGALQIIRERTATLARLIHNLTMLQSVPQEALAMTPLSIVEIMEDVLMEFQRSADNLGIVFEQDFAENVPQVMGDSERLQTAFGHLIDNAIKFSPGGGQVELRIWHDEQSVGVSVSDQGIGIPAEHLDDIFECFYQVDGSTSRRFGGMGIGLALVWEIVEIHNGKVDVKSEPGEGSEFIILLPRMDRCSVDERAGENR